MDEIKGQRMIMRGLVQGVGYRFYCRNAAEKAGINGYVKNIEDGNVLIEAYGKQSDINRFIIEITRKDKAFSVVDFDVVDIEPDERCRGFSIKLY